MKHLRRATFLVCTTIVVGLFGCPGGTGGPSGCDGPSDTPPAAVPSSDQFVVSPRDGAKVVAESVAVVGNLPAGSTNVIVGGREAFLQPDGSFIAADIPLQRNGPTSIRVVAVDAERRITQIATLAVERTGDAEPLVLSLSPEYVPTGGKSTIRAITPFPVSSLKLDLDADGVPETSAPDGAIEHVFGVAGQFGVWGLIQDAEGNYFTSGMGRDSQGRFRIRVGATQDRTGSVAIADGRDIDLSPDGKIAVLSGNGVVTLLDENLAVLSTVTLTGLSSPAGFCLTSTGFLVADTGNHRVVQFSTNGTPAATFGVGGAVGAVGSGQDQFSSPTDVAMDTSYGYVFVADNGNHRVVRLRSNGRWDSDFDFPSGPVALAAGDGPLIIADGSSTLRAYTADFAALFETNAGGDVRRVTADFGAPVELGYGAVFANGVALIREEGGRTVDVGAWGSETRGVVFRPSESSPSVTLFVLDTAGVHRVSVSTDATLGDPLSVWNALIGHVQAGEFDAALALLVPEERARYGRLFQSDGLSMQNGARNYRVPVVVSVSDETAYLEVPVEGASEPRNIQLRRSGLSGEWRVAGM